MSSKGIIVGCVFLVLNFSVGAQDTIWFNNNTVEVVRLLEISDFEVRFKRFDYLNGPEIVKSNAEINKIRLSNGEFVQLAEIQTNPPQENQSPQYLPIIEYNQVMYHDGKKIGERNLYLLVQRAPNLDGKVEMLSAFDEMKRHKRKQYQIFFIGGGIGVYVTAFSGLLFMSSSLSQSDSTPWLVAGGLGISTVMTSAILATNHKNQRYEKRTKVIQLYNNIIARNASDLH